MEHKWLRCKKPDDVLCITKSFFENCNDAIELPCGHPHLIVCTDDLKDMTFEDKEKVRKMLDDPR